MSREKKRVNATPLYKSRTIALENYDPGRGGKGLNKPSYNKPINNRVKVDWISEHYIPPIFYLLHGLFFGLIVQQGRI